MADKVSAGQPIPRSASLWNNMIGAANEFAARQLGQAGAGLPATPPPTDTVKIKNSSGVQVRLGEVLEIRGFLLSSVTRGFLWFDADTPDTTDELLTEEDTDETEIILTEEDEDIEGEDRSRPFVITQQDIPAGSIDRAQLSGACVALVNVTDAGHNFAAPASGQRVLQSAGGGPVRLLYKPAGTGEKLCAVLLPSGQQRLKQFCRFTLDSSMDDSDSHQDATITAQYGEGLEHTVTDIEVWNLETHASGVFMFTGAMGAVGYAFYDEPNDKWIIIQMECPW